MEVKKVDYDQYYISGCKTCDWGSSYINEISITLEDNTYIEVKIDKMYDYVLSESDYMQLLANSKDINNFVVNIIEKIKNKRFDKNLYCPISLEGLNIKVNGKDIDIKESLKKGKIIEEVEE